MTILPQPARRRRAAYLPPHKRRCAPIPARSFPQGVRVGSDAWSSYHEYLQADGRWTRCGGRGRCRECINEEAAKTVEQRIREGLAVRHDIDRLMQIDIGSALFGSVLDDNEVARSETLIALDYEFQTSLPDAAVEGNVTIASLVAAVEKVRAS